MATSRMYVAAVMVASLFFIFGCGNAPISPDADAGPVAMSDADLPTPDGGGGCVWTRDNPCDAGPPMPDAGYDAATVSDGGTCTPTQSNPLCTGADSCECYCEGSPEDCSGPMGANQCEPGVYNRCGFHLPMSMDTYRYDEWRTECNPFIMFNTWFTTGSETTVWTEWLNNELHMFLEAAGVLICGNEGKCWHNWANADLFGSPGDHSVIEFAPDCRAMREELYRGGALRCVDFPEAACPIAGPSEYCGGMECGNVPAIPYDTQFYSFVR